MQYYATMCDVLLCVTLGYSRQHYTELCVTLGYIRQHYTEL